MLFTTKAPTCCSDSSHVRNFNFNVSGETASTYQRVVALGNDSTLTKLSGISVMESTKCTFPQAPDRQCSVNSCCA